MLVKHKSTLRLGLVLLSLFAILSYYFQFGFVYTVFAENATTSVTVSNTPPDFDAGGDSYEDPVSFSGTPINVGALQTWKATGDDPNNDAYYLAICKTNAITANDGAAPTCNGGSWCVSSSTVDTVEANCTYTWLQTDTSEATAWYAFVCDAVPAGANCSASSQGTGNSGSDAYVNHRPAFTAIVDDGGSGANTGDNPGGTMQFNATASDSDSDGGADTVNLFVCADNSGLNVGATACNGTQLCTSGLTASNPSCTYNLATIVQDGSYNYYAHVVDSHGLEAASNQTGAYTVNNVNPVVSNVEVNGSLDMALTESTTTDFDVTGTVTDNNSCQDLNVVTTSLYRESITYTGCDANGEDDNNDCYAVVSCSVVGSGNTCNSSTDASADYVCTVSVQYHADPSDTDYAGYLAANEEWFGTILATDDSTATHSAESASGVEVLSLVALDVTAAINYGSVNPGTNTGATNQTAIVTATGNVGIDTDLAGNEPVVGKALCTDYPTCSSDGIPVENQKYSVSNVTYASLGGTLSTTNQELELNVAKTIVTGSPATSNIYWGIAVPLSLGAGTYTGQNTIVAVKSEVAGW